MFPPQDAARLLAECHRRCCICHRFCGVKMELDHICQRAEGGTDEIENAIPVCFDCHAEIHSYNSSHPRGRKFREEELKQHKAEWLRICRENPGALLSAPLNQDVGPLHALLDELQFNLEASKGPTVDNLGCLFRDQQFARAVGMGSIAALDPELKRLLIEAYVAMGRANQWIHSAMNMSRRSTAATYAYEDARNGIRDAGPPVSAALQALTQFLAPEDAGAV